MARGSDGALSEVMVSTVVSAPSFGSMELVVDAISIVSELFGCIGA